MANQVNLRDITTGEVLTVAPFNSRVTLDSSPIPSYIHATKYEEKIAH